jgi:hypothetical protein
LGTADDAEADRLVAQLNELLQDAALWEPAAQPAAVARFDPRVVDIFYEGLQAQRVDYRAIRNEILPMPPPELDYRTALLLGTTGAGKTTLVRQLLGTNPETERFPSTSTAKTTIADTELIFDRSPKFRAVVTFVGHDEVVDALGECVSEAGLALFRKADASEVRRRLLDHPDQRFRFSYILGRSVQGDDDDVDDDNTDSLQDDLDTEELVDAATTADVINRSIETLQALVLDHDASVREVLGQGENDERVLDELIEESLDSALRDDERFHAIVDEMVEEIEKRFGLLAVGTLRRNRQGWPMNWSWETSERSAFLKAVTRYSSNNARLFGSLLTPLVNGMRVAGPFEPAWLEGMATRLVLIDGEGLGHDATSVAALSTSVSKRIDEVDAVILVDNATQPMQAAPVAAMKALVTSGAAGKLVFCFTHFDLVKGDNLRTFSEREEHVKASGENVLKAIGEDLGPLAERILRQQLVRRCFFAGGIDGTLDPKRKAGRRSIDQLTGLLDVLDHIVDQPEGSVVRPVYDRANLVLAVREGAEGFHNLWSARLGFVSNPQVPKQHWTRIKALSRRFAEGWDDEYDTLKPVAELKRELEMQIYRMLQQPVRWEGGEPTEEDKQQVIDGFANAVAKEVYELSARRIDSERKANWREAFSQSGTGSTFVRARIISAEVYDKAAPVPSVVPSPDQNRFLREVSGMVDRVANDRGVHLV